MPKQYDVAKAFEVIEDNLISSMMKNLDKHVNDEIAENFNWNMWQAEQLAALNEYKLTNQKIFNNYSGTISDELDLLLQKSYNDGMLSAEHEILQAVKHGYNTAFTDKKFFTINDKKLNALIGATKSDFKKASTAMLRKSSDEYRKIIFNAQVYAATGSGTVRQAIDMATKDFLASGINCIQYSNGAKVPIDAYSEMAIRTTSKRATLLGEGRKRSEWGVDLVKVTANASACPMCLQWVGQVYVDDVWSGGKKKGANYPLLSTAIAGGLYHPNCRDSHTTYFEGINREPVPMSEADKDEARRIYKLEQKQRYCERNVRKYGRLSEFSLDAENKAKYTDLAKKWQTELSTLVKEHPELRMNSSRVKTYGIDINNLKWVDSPDKINADKIKQYVKSQQTFENNTFSGIWKEEVTPKDYNAKKASIESKKAYFKNKIAQGQDVEKFTKLLEDLDQFEIQGQLYNEFQRLIDELTPKPKIKKSNMKGKKGKINEALYTQERKDKAYWFKDTQGQKSKADAIFRPETGEIWKTLSYSEKEALYEYTAGSGKYNRPLSGFDRDWDKAYKRGVGNVSLDNEHAGKAIEAMTEVLEKTSSKHDIWLSRGCTSSAMDSFFNIDNFASLSESELQNYVDTTGVITSFVSCGTTKGTGFQDRVMLNIYAPEGTKMMYAEPFSHYNNTKVHVDWDGEQDADPWNIGIEMFGLEFETIIQRGYTYHVTKAYKEGGTTYLDLEILIDLGNYFVK